MTTEEPDGQTRFQKVRSRLIEFIRNEVDLGANIAVVTFGEGAALVARERIRTDADKARLIQRIEKMKADAQATYMAAGIDIAVQALRALAKEHPGRSRMLVLLTDGKNQPPRSVPPEHRLTFQKLLQSYKSLPGFKPGEDWFFWYCFIGKADEQTQKFVESMAGEPKAVTGPWRFRKVRFNRVVVNLGDVATGDWTAEFPSQADRKLGESLRATTRAPGEYQLQFSDVLLDEAGKGETITVSPRTVSMAKADQAVVLRLTARNVAAGERRGRIVIRSPGKMVFVRPQQFHVRFRASAAEVLVAQRDGVRFGRIAPGKAETKTIDLIPSEMARRIAAGKRAALVLPKDLPAPPRSRWRSVRLSG
ncbi:MAG: hypothetical protein AMS14_11825 [Planctomycetes bacterium DG_20]|nr:MAG: hypothetical protein AMS14_11825 [Planctomycetes bacterium DG_20]